MKRGLVLLFLSGLVIQGAAAASPINTQIGFAVSLDGGWLAVGSPRDDAKGEDAGAVRLFQRVFPCWVLRQTITASDAQPEALFGSSVSLRNGVLAVAAAGAEAVYTSTLLPDATWSQPARLPAADDSPSRRFGQSVAIAASGGGWRLAVGDMDSHGHMPGMVQVFEGPPGNKVAVLTPVTPRERERFGHAVSLRGDLLVVGAPGSAQDAGAVYVFRRQESGWEEQAVLTAADGLAGDQLGYSVAVDGDEALIVAGAPTAGDGNEGAAYAYVFSVESGTWKQVRKLPAVGAGGHGGLSVAIDSGRIAVGAPLPFSARTGVLLIFERGPADWSEPPQDLVAAHGSAYDLAGFSVALEQVILGELTVAAGAPLADTLRQGDDFFTLTPCRVLDTRDPPAPLNAGETRIVPMAGSCGIPNGASAVSVNLTVVGPSAAGGLTAFPANEPRPTASAISYRAGLVRANNGVLKLGNGALAIFADQPFGTVDLIVDVNGYFMKSGAVENSSAGAFYSVIGEFCQGNP